LVIDLKLLRDEPDAVRAAYDRRGGVEGLDRVVELDRRHRDLLRKVEDLRAEQNKASKSIAQAASEDRPAAIAKAKTLADEIKALEPDLERA
jgi:seryl-tRNA synthetase